MSSETARRLAKAELDNEFGLGRDAVHKELEVNSVAWALYECAVRVIARHYSK